MPVRYREIRAGELDDAVAFAGERGSSVTPERVRHALSLLAYDGDAAVGCALCVADDGGLVTIELGLTDEAVQQGLGKTLADTALRKVQSAGVGTARIVSLNDGEADRLWQAAGWLNRLPETGRACTGDESDTPGDTRADAATSEPEPVEAAQPA